MLNEQQPPVSNQAESDYRATFTGGSLTITDAAPPPDQAEPIRRIPRAFEQLGAPLHINDRSRAFLTTLPLAGMRQVGHAIRVAIDSGVPVKCVDLDVELDREEDWDELVAKLRVVLPYSEALKTWETIETRLYSARAQLRPEDRIKMEEGFALYVDWEENP